MTKTCSSNEYIYVCDEEFIRSKNPKIKDIIKSMMSLDTSQLQDGSMSCMDQSKLDH